MNRLCDSSFKKQRLRLDYATHAFKNNDYESTQATLDQNWGHERYRQLWLCIKIGMCLQEQVESVNISFRKGSYLVMNYVMVPAEIIKFLEYFF